MGCGSESSFVVYLFANELKGELTRRGWAVRSDNNEYLLHNDDYEPRWDEETRKTNSFDGKINIGTLGRMYNVSSATPGLSSNHSHKRSY